MSNKVAVMLAGCGVYDGSEIYETVLTLLRLSEAGQPYQCMAPDVEQMHVIDHRTGEETGETRNVLTEASRLARGEIIDLADASPEDYAALIIPGGFGVAKNLCDFAVSGADMSIREDVASFVTAMHEAGKPVGLICIAPTMVPKLFGAGARCTIGNDPEVSAAIEAMGGNHENCAVDEFCVDAERKLVTTPAYMLAGSIADANSGISRLVDQVLEWMK